MNAISASGNSIPISATSFATLRIADVVTEVRINFIKDEKFNPSRDYDLIIGCDILALLPPVTFNYRNRIVTFGTKPPIKLSNRNETFITAVKSITIPPQSQVVISGKLPEDENHSAYIVEQLGPRQLEAHLSTLPTVVAPFNNLIPVVVVNPTQAHVQIFKDMKLAQVTRLYELTSMSTDTLNTLDAEIDIKEIDESFTIDFSQSSVIGENLEKLKQLCSEYQDIFSRNKYDLGSCSVGYHDIKTTTDTPVSVKPRRTPFKSREFLEKHVNALIKSGVMIESDTPWVSNFVLVQKKDGSLRPCIDFRKLNEVTIPDHYPLP